MITVVSRFAGKQVPAVCMALTAAFIVDFVAAQTPAIPETEAAASSRRIASADPRAQALEERIESLAQEVRTRPDDAELLASYGLSLVRYGRHDEGLNALMRAAAKSPGDPRVLLLYSKALIRTGSVEQAVIKALSAAKSPLSTKDEIGEAYSVAGFARLRQGNLEEAETYLKEAVEHTPRDAGANLNLGLVLYGSGNRATGIALMEKAALLAPEDPRIQRIVADLYDNMGQSEKSLEAWEAVSAAYPNDLEIRLKLATGWLALNRADRAVSHLQHAATSEPPSRRIQQLLASALAATGDYDAARAHAEEARRLGANVTTLLQSINEDEAAARDE